jgi:hypothetical protein
VRDALRRSRKPATLKKRKAPMKTPLNIWLTWFVFLLLLDVLFPFYLLVDVPNVKGSFLFWICWTLLAIASMFAIFLRWRDDPAADRK